MRILICGDRNWSDSEFIGRVLDSYLSQHKKVTVIHGACRGADSLGAREAYRRGLEVIAVPAQWKLYGRAASPIRNKQMLDMGVDMVIAFHNDIESSAGTRNMLLQSSKRGVPYKLYTLK